MKIKQLSLFLENKPGHLSAVCRALGGAGINILTLSLADTQQFGILRLIVSDPERARQALKEAGFVCNIAEIVGVQVADRPGGLAALLEKLEASQVNIEYMYPLNVRRGEDAAIAFCFDAPGDAIQVLEKNGYRVVGLEEYSACAKP